MGIKGRKARIHGLASRKALVLAAFFSLLHVQATFLRLDEELRDKFKL